MDSSSKTRMAYSMNIFKFIKCYIMKNHCYILSITNEVNIKNKCVNHREKLLEDTCIVDHHQQCNKCGHKKNFGCNTSGWTIYF
jgi:predicted transcriptional regulator